MPSDFFHFYSIPLNNSLLLHAIDKPVNFYPIPLPFAAVITTSLTLSVFWGNDISTPSRWKGKGKKSPPPLRNQNPLPHISKEEKKSPPVGELPWAMAPKHRAPPKPSIPKSMETTEIPSNPAGSGSVRLQGVALEDPVGVVDGGSDDFVRAALDLAAVELGDLELGGHELGVPRALEAPKHARGVGRRDAPDDAALQAPDGVAMGAPEAQMCEERSAQEGLQQRGIGTVEHNIEGMDVFTTYVLDIRYMNNHSRGEGGYVFDLSIDSDTTNYKDFVDELHNKYPWGFHETVSMQYWDSLHATAQDKEQEESPCSIT
ncbi:hypothetical protein ACP70R_032525 [Stipagrostis hirtigluma subsp. patula]